jgi:hypothetical protein
MTNKLKNNGFLSDIRAMKLPIALSPLNTLLLGLMLVAPYLGTLAKKRVHEVKQVEKLELILTQARQRNATQSIKQKLENETSRGKAHNPSLKKPILDELPHRLSSREAPLSSSIKPRPSHQNFLEKMKTFARTRDFAQAEEEFLRHLEHKALSPLESLQRHSEFKSKFKGLADYLASGTNKSI